MQITTISAIIQACILISILVSAWCILFKTKKIKN